MAESFHAEHKVTGGKLVVADVDTHSGVIVDATISGDFFLEPDEAFFAIAPALVGASVGDDTAALTARIDAALAPYADELDLQGVSVADIALVVRRAVTKARDFTDFDWEVVHSPVLPTRLNVALDEYLLREVAAGRRGPLLRFWEWEDRAAVIGSFQSFVNEIDPAGVERHGIDVVRRISGGGAMFMEGGNCITYSLYAPDDLVAGLGYEASYVYLDQWVLDALAAHGVNAWYKPINDITSDNGKIGGAAQKRVRGGILHHATMSYDIDADKMVEVLRIGKAKISDKGIASAKKRVDPLRRQTGASRQEIITTMIDTFTAKYGARRAELTDDDLAGAQRLVDEKFGTEEWTRRVP